MSAGTWADLASAALLGTSRRRVSDIVLPGPLAEASAVVPPADDDAVRLLNVAALATVYLRAGMRCRPAPALPAPAPVDTRRPVSPAARDRLSSLLSGTDRELLTLWLDLAAERGFRPPTLILPTLLDLAVRDLAEQGQHSYSGHLADAVLAAAGPRGRWLAAQRPHWAALLRGGSPAAGGDSAAHRGIGAAAGPELVGSPSPADEDPRLWEVGTPPERLSWLAGYRSRAAAEARELLEAGWAREAPTERARLLAVLAEGLGPADEPFLERCLADRRGDVRATAVQLLGTLPGSAFTRRATGRALAAVRLERHLMHRRLAVTPPTERDPVMARDQIPAPPAQLGGGGGPGAWLLRHVVAAAPLRAWVPTLGTSAADVVGLDVADGWRPMLWFGWARAAVREQDPTWAAALLGRPPSPGSRRIFAHRDPDDLLVTIADLLGVLAGPERMSQVAALLEGPASGQLPAAELLRPIPGPWEPPLTGAVLGWLGRRPRLDDVDGQGVLDLAAHRLPTVLTPAVRAIADQWPEGSRGRRLAAVAAEVMTVRRKMIEELQ